MNNNVSIFKHEQFGELRVLGSYDKPYFIAKDVCRILGISNARMAMQRLKDREKGVSQADTPGGTQTVTTISEAGFYRLVLRSDKPYAETFQDWVVEEVLPSIRKHGAYIPVNEGDTPAVIMARGLKAAESIVAELQEKIASDAPKVELHDRFLDEGEDISVGALAKKLAQEGLPFGQNRLFDYLRRQKVLCSKRGINFNMPIQKYLDRGWFRVIAPPASMRDRWTARVYVTPKGVKDISARIHDLFNAVSFN